MRDDHVNIDDFGMDTVSLAGTLPQRLAAIRGAGFSQATLAARDLAGHLGGVDEAVRLVRESGLRIHAFQALRDFEGLTGRPHEYKLQVARSMLEMCHAVGAKLLLVCSSTSPHASADPDALARDLRKLAMLAVPFGIRIAYEALSWGRAVDDFPAAWDIVCRADAPNLGLAIDAFHTLASGTPLEDVDILDPDKIFLVQLADFLWQALPSTEQRLDAACHFRVFPGEGAHSEQVAELVVRLDALGYRGDYAFEVDNDDYRQMPLATVAQRAHRAAVWLAEDVLHRSVPLPGRMRLRAV